MKNSSTFKLFSAIDRIERHNEIFFLLNWYSEQKKKLFVMFAFYRLQV